MHVSLGGEGEVSSESCEQLFAEHVVESCLGGREGYNAYIYCILWNLSLRTLLKGRKKEFFSVQT